MESNLWWTNQRTSRMCEWSCILVNAVWVNGECSASGLQVRALWVHFVHFWVKHELAFCAFLLRSESVLHTCNSGSEVGSSEFTLSALWVKFMSSVCSFCILHFAVCAFCILYFSVCILSAIARVQCLWSWPQVKQVGADPTRLGGHFQ